MLEFLKLHCALTREFLGLALHFPAGLVLDMVLTEYGFAIFVNLNLEMGWAQILQIIIIIFFQFWATWINLKLRANKLWKISNKNDTNLWRKKWKNWLALFEF